MEYDPSQTTLALWEIFSFAMLDLSKRNRWDGTYWRKLELKTILTVCIREGKNWASAIQSWCPVLLLGNFLQKAKRDRYFCSRFVKFFMVNSPFFFYYFFPKALVAYQRTLKPVSNSLSIFSNPLECIYILTY